MHSHHDNVLELASASRSRHNAIAMEIHEQVPLAPLTTFRIGGPARFFVRARTLEDIQAALSFAKENNVSVYILGGGANVLFDDAGFAGLVIKIEIAGVERRGAMLIAGAGESWDALVERAVADGLWGIENLSGISGTVGGAVVQNIGAYGAALSQTLMWADAYDTRTGETARIDAAQYQSGYRDSMFKREPGRYIVMRAAMQLSDVPTPNLSYKDLAGRFAAETPRLEDIREAVLAIRREKFPDLAREGTAGSFFKNPVVPPAAAQALAAQYPGLPLFPLPESGDIKVPLGWFLDYRHGVVDMRDVRAGGARMYEKQFLVIAAEQGTTSADVRRLASLVQQKIRDTLAIEIEPEVCIVKHKSNPGTL